LKFAISYSPQFHGVDPETLVGYARHAEECGFEAIYLPEHIVLYPGAKIGEMPIPPALDIPDPLDTLAFVAAATSRILLGTGVLLLPYHHPVVLAKRLATIDVLSRGRMRLFTVGLGTLPGEAHAVGVDFASRGRRADEAIDVLRLLWGGGEEGVSFHGEFFDFDDLTCYPKPYGVKDLPIHIGGSSRPAARRAGKRGDGWFAGGLLHPDERRAHLDLARAEAVRAGRDPDALEVTRWASIDVTPQRVEALAAEGTTRIVVGASAEDQAERYAQMDAFAERFGLGVAA
jgi:probable F420-dependent oxidoreductase